MLKELKEIIKHPYDLTENYHLFNEFITFDGKWIQPKHKWSGRKPKIGAMVDDAQSTRIFRNRHFLNLCTRSTHIGSFEGDEASKVLVCSSLVKTTPQPGAVCPEP